MSSMFELHVFDALPIWVMLGLIFTIILLAFELGYRLAQRAKGESDVAIGPMTAGLASLLAFILAFTFSIAANKNGVRKQLVLDEANVIGTTYLRAEMLDEPYRGRSQALLRQYISDRVQVNPTLSKVAEIVERSEDIHTELWQLAMQSYHVSDGGKSKSYIASLNDLIDTHNNRLNYGFRNRIPVSIWLTLGLLTLLTITINGIQIGMNNPGRSLMVVVPFTLAFSIVLCLIIELDRPARSIIAVSQQPMIDLKESLNID